MTFRANQIVHIKHLAAGQMLQNAAGPGGSRNTILLDIGKPPATLGCALALHAGNKVYFISDMRAQLAQQREQPRDLRIRLCEADLRLPWR